ncbi:MAG: type II secretion system protein [Elusimicrobia bacterium]|nr:type II secretion system protein [Elusimicrobiota bacterium]
MVADQESAQKGYTLIEVVVAMLLIGLMSALCMPAFLTGRMADGRAARRAAAADAVHRAAEELKAYVTADIGAGTRGPGTNCSGNANGWCLPGDASGSWALDHNVAHNLTGAPWAALLATWGGTLSYSVAVPDATKSSLVQQPTVTFNVAWSEP